MIYQIDYKELVRKINPIVFAKYLEDTNWQVFQTKKSDIRIFQKELNDFFQVTIPMNEKLSDYEEALLKACEIVAQAENRSLEQLLLYLLNPNADILKIRIEKKDIETGSILLDDAIGLYENAKKLLGAAAQDVLKPALVHQGRTDNTVNSFISICKFGQTEVGSYVISVICPMTEVEEGEVRQLSLFEEEKEEENFTRTVTTKVIKSIQQIKSRIDSGEYNLAETSKEDNISANFYEALIGINLSNNDVAVDFIPEWTPSKTLPENMPSVISLSHKYYDPIHSTVTQLKGKTRKKKKIVGKIKRLESSPNVESRTAGKITVVYIDDNNKAKTITATLEKHDYDQAIEAHSKGWYVEIVGETHEKKRNEIECESFSALE